MVFRGGRRAVRIRSPRRPHEEDDRRRRSPAARLAFAGQAMAQEKLTVWWVKGFYKAEDDALFAAIKKFEAKHPKIKIELSQYPVQDMIPKTVAALDSGSPPDVAYADVYDFQVTAQVGLRRQARGHHQRHRSDARAASRRTRVETTFLYNDKTKTRAYYAFPIKQQTMHIEYWNDMLAEAGFKESRHPDHLEGVLELLVRQGPAGLPAEDRQPRASASASRSASTRATRSTRS